MEIERRIDSKNDPGQNAERRQDDERGTRHGTSALSPEISPERSRLVCSKFRLSTTLAEPSADCGSALPALRRPEVRAYPRIFRVWRLELNFVHPRPGGVNKAAITPGPAQDRLGESFRPDLQGLAEARYLRMVDP